MKKQLHKKYVNGYCRNCTWKRIRKRIRGRKEENQKFNIEEKIAMISHEIRTPLNGIQGLTALALEEKRIDRVYEYLTNIQESTSDLLDILNNTIDSSKISSKKMQLVEQPFSLRNLINKCLSLISSQLKEKGLELLLTIHDSIQENYVGDALRLEQILNNILSNAVKYTMEGYVELIVKETKDGILFIVSDTGIGIKKEFMNRIFEPFQQGENTKIRTRDAAGLGLGLVRQLVELMDGLIHISSEENNGTTVQLLLPLQVCEEEKDDGEKMKYSGNVLVVEDNKVNQVVAVEMLSKFGVKVTIAKDGYHAIELTEKEAFDLIFMDIFMPYMSGLMTAKQIRLRNIICPIIAMTGTEYQDAVHEYKKAGINDVVIKPYSMQRINEILHTYLKTNNCNEKGIGGKRKREGDSFYFFTRINAKNAIEKLGMNQDVYETILRSFQKEYCNKIDNFQDIIIHDKQVAFRYVHSLKGVSNTIGAKVLSKYCEKLERQLQMGDYDKTMVMRCIKECKAVLKEVIEYNDSKNTIQYTYEYNKDNVKSIIEKLRGYLSSHDAESVDMIPEIYHNLYKNSWELLLNQLVEEIEQYEFDKALIKLDHLIETMKEESENEAKCTNH